MIRIRVALLLLVSGVVSMPLLSITIIVDIAIALLLLFGVIVLLLY